MHNFLVIILLSASFSLFAQTTATFEDFNLPAESFLNGSDGNGGFFNGNTFLPNTYDDSFGSWTGWSISNTTDLSTPGFTNQYSAITGTGFESSATYAVGYTATTNGSINITLENAAAGEKVKGLYLTNSTYAYLSMRDGDSFAKRFGGVTASDPDYFLLTIKKYQNGELSTESVEVYLADYRFENNAEDYILDEWIYVDLTVLGQVDSLQFSLTSSDTGALGMNTPAYFCIDNLTTSDGTTSVSDEEVNQTFILSPNPVSDFLNIKHDEVERMNYQIFDSFGREVLQGNFTNENRINLAFLPKGIYVLRLENNRFIESQVFLKQ